MCRASGIVPAPTQEIQKDTLGRKGRKGLCSVGEHGTPQKESKSGLLTLSLSRFLRKVIMVGNALWKGSGNRSNYNTGSRKL